MLSLTFTCRVLLIYLLSNSVKMTDEYQQLVLEQQWRQACLSARFCTRGRHRVVCGSNGRLYKSLCSFQRAQCINRLLKTAKLSTCTADALKSKCQLARSQALRASARSDNFAVFIPECKADGTYKEVQCHSQTGYCWCSMPDGIPVSGSSVQHLRPDCTRQISAVGRETDLESKRGVQSTPDPDQRSVSTANGVTVPPFWLLILLNAAPPGNGSDRRSADSLKTCQNERISLLKAAAQASEERFIPECTADGRYRAVQCHSGTGYCWCVRQDSGRPIPGTADRDQEPDCISQKTQKIILNSSHRETPLSGCPSVGEADVLKRLLDELQQEVENGAQSSAYRTPGISSTLQTLHQYFSGLDADADGFLSKRESRPLHLLIRRALHPRRCAKKLFQSCERTTDRGFSPQQLTACLGF